MVPSGFVIVSSSSLQYSIAYMLEIVFTILFQFIINSTYPKIFPTGIFPGIAQEHLLDILFKVISNKLGTKED